MAHTLQAAKYKSRISNPTLIHWRKIVCGQPISHSVVAECEWKSGEGGRPGLHGRLSALKREGDEPGMGTGSRTADHPFEVLARQWGQLIAVGCEERGGR